MAADHALALAPDRSSIRWPAALANAWRAAGPPLLFGVRLWASVCLALYVAFWLELDHAYWAGTSAGLMCQPRLGASLRKGWFRMIGTLVGALGIVAVTACFPQQRAGFLIALALGCALCAFLTTILRNFAAHAAALAGFTAVIIASDQLGPTGGPNGDAFMLAIARASEICIGIVSAGLVLGLTDFGFAPRRLAGLFAVLSMEIANRFGNTLASSGSSDTQPGRRELTRAVIALDPVVDEAIGESSRLRYHSPVLQAAIEGLLAALAAWRIVAVRLTRLPDTAAQSEAEAVLRILPEALRSGAHDAEPTFWLANPTRMRRLCETAAGTLNAMPTGTPSLRLLADQTARVLAGLSDALRGLALLGDDLAQPRSRHQRARLHVPDWLPAFVNAGRAFAIIGAVEVFWIVTAWPNGAFAITWTAIPVLLFSPTADQGYARATSFMMGSGLAVVCAAIVLFAVLPNLETFAGFSMAIGLYLVPVGALMAQAWHTAMFIPMAGNFVPLLGPANQMAYDTVGFYNSALAIFAGCAAAALSFRLLPPLSPALQTRRLLALSSHDLRRLATDVLRRLPTDWEGRLYSRIAALPDAAEPLHRAQLLAALSVGTEIMHLRRVAAQLGVTSELDAALEPFARGDSVAAIARLERLDRRLASCPESDPQTSAALHERARILLICDALVEHRAYFDGGEAN